MAPSASRSRRSGLNCTPQLSPDTDAVPAICDTEISALASKRSGMRGLRLDQRFEVQDGRERVVEVVQELPPLLVLGRPPKPFRVILETVPLDQEEVARG